MNITTDPSLAPTRRVPLEGASNFRDLGGYATRGGQTVRWRTVFRSGALDRLTDMDLASLEALGLRTVCDLRHDDEVKANPSRLPQANPPTTFNLPIRTAANGLLRALVERRDPDTAQDVHDTLTESYRCYVRDHTDVYGDLMHRLADADNLPLVFHCSAGKDRTGFGAALLLMTLGVPEETIFEDYRLTNTYWTEGRQRLPGTLPDTLRDAVIAANDAYLRAAIDTLHEVHQSLDVYLTRGLRMDAETVARLRDLLLE